MGTPHQIKDKDLMPSGFFYVTDTPLLLTDEQSGIFDSDEETGILIITTAGCDYAVGTNPDGTGQLHKAPAGVFPLGIHAGGQLYISGTANISVVE